MTYMFYIFAMGDCHGPYQESPDYGMEDEGEHNLWEKVCLWDGMDQHRSRRNVYVHVSRHTRGNGRVW